MLALGANGRGRAGLLSALRPQDVFQILTQPANQMQAAISALPFTPDILIDKDRVATGDWSWRDSARGLGQTLASNTTAAEVAWPGYSGTNNRVVFALKQQAKVAVRTTYTGDGASGRVIPHGLGIKPGMIIVKRRDAASQSFGGWYTYHRSLGATQALLLNNTAAAFNDPVWGSAEPTAASFTVGNFQDVNAAGATYVAYLFAHDPDTTNGIVQCGSFTADGAGNGSVTLGWRPQFVITKGSSDVSEWLMLDTTRGWSSGSVAALLTANASRAEAVNTDYGGPTATGFVAKNGAPNANIYLAIRAPIT